MSHHTEKYVCDRCGFDFKKSKLKRQRGMWLSHDCYDDLSKIPTHRPRFNSPRDNSTSTDIPAEATPEVLTVSSGTGINQIFQTHELSTRRDGVHKSTIMWVVSDGGAITISADPQIITASVGDILTLRGTSNTDTVQLNDTDSLHLIGGHAMILKEGDTITFTFNDFTDVPVGGWGISQWGSTGYGFGGAATEGWVEVSRYKGGI